MKQGDKHVLGPGGIFSFLQGKFKYSVQFIDSDAEPLSFSTSSNDTSSKGSKLVNLFNKGLKTFSSKTKLIADEEHGVDSTTFQNHQNSSDKKRKREGKEAVKSDSIKKFRRSLTGQLSTSTSSAEKFVDIDMQDLKEEFGDEIIKEINKDMIDTRFGNKQMNNVINETQGADGQFDKSVKPAKNIATSECIKKSNKVGTSCVAKESKWTSQDSLMVFTSKGTESREKVGTLEDMHYFLKFYMYNNLFLPAFTL